MSCRQGTPGARVQSNAVLWSYGVDKDVLKLTFVVLAALLALQPRFAAARSAESFPGDPVKIETLRAQEQAEDSFDRGDFERAFFIYRNELAPIGDKYSQYMVGYLYLTGRGVEEDRVAAAAWYRLASERGTRQFVSVYEQLSSTLTEEQAGASSQLFLQLRQEFGDLALLMKAVRADYRALDLKTGTRLGGERGDRPTTVIDVRARGSAVSGTDYARRIRKRMQERLEFIGQWLETDTLQLDADNLDLEQLEARVMERLQTLD